MIYPLEVRISNIVAKSCEKSAFNICKIHMVMKYCLEYFKFQLSGNCTSIGLRPGVKWWIVLGILLLGPLEVYAQYSVQGVVKDITGAGVPYVNVVVQSNHATTMTDEQGHYVISVPSTEDTLVFMRLNYEQRKVALQGRSTVDVTMAARPQSLNEVVVTGYGTQQKKDIIGSISVVDVNKMQSQPTVSVDRALQGMASGVNVVSSGVPGEASQISIRGMTSFGDNSPLVIVDGIERSLVEIDPSDIESIQVLKDAGAAAIYGVRGANGVIVVTTKKGKAGPPVISYDGSFGVTYPLPGNVWDLMNSTDYMKVYNIAFPGNELFANGLPDYTYRGPGGAGVGMEGDPAVDPSLYFYQEKNTGKNYIIQKVNKGREDWFHDLFKKAVTQNHNISASGGTENARYFFGLGYTDQGGTLYKTYYKRYTARINSDFSINKHIKIGENASIYFKQAPGFGDQSEFGLLSDTYKMMPIVPLRDIMGNWAGTYGGPSLGTFHNPVAVQDRNVSKDVSNIWNISGNVYAEVSFLKHFKARSSIGVNYTNAYSKNFTPTSTEDVQASTKDNSLSITSTYYSTMTFTNTLQYNQQFGKHDLNLLVGSEAIKYISRSVNGSSDAFYAEDVNYLDLDNGTLNINNSSSDAATALASLFGRLDYSYHDRYLLGLTLRRDGSSKFGPENRYGVFPSLSVGWRVSNEPFMQGIAWVNDLKIRGSYGILGSQNNVSADNAYSLFGASVSSTYYDITGSSTSSVQGFSETRIGNLATGWEKDIVTNVGFDATLFNYKLDISASYYKKAVKGLLFTESLPAVILGGAAAPTINIGDIKNNGLDITFNYHDRINEDWSFNAGLNLTSYKNEIVYIPDPGYFFSGSLQGFGSIARNEVGHPISSFYGYKIVGLFNSDEDVAASPTQTAAAPGRFKYQDTDGDGRITTSDEVFLGSPNPDFTYGLTLGINYKNFDFSAIFYGSQGNKIYNTTLDYLDFMQYYFGAKSNRLKKAWTPDNTHTTVPKIEAVSSFSTNTVSNSYFVKDGSYLMLKSLVLGYSLRPALLKRVGVDKFRLYLQGANLFTLTKYSGLDPELTGSSSDFGIDYGIYPSNEMNIIVGVQLTF